MTHPLRVAFAGTPEFAVPHLAACRLPAVSIVAVYTQPDRPAGRGRKPTPSPVKMAALDAGYIVEQPDALKALSVQEHLRTLRPDLLIVVAYGLILPRKVLAIPRLGCWNVHASLLPRWRGAAPIQRAILAGDPESGVSLMQMEPGLDTGPVLLERRLPIAPQDTGGSLHDRLAALGAEVLADALRRALAGEKLEPRPQAATGVTYAHKLDKAEARMDWGESVIALERKVRAFDPWPVAEADLGGERLRIWSARILKEGPCGDPGRIVAAGREGIDVSCKDGLLRILEVQRAGGRRIRASDYLNGRPDLGQTKP
jgi:methionyl-tRNA formyltransferase